VRAERRHHLDPGDLVHDAVDQELAAADEIPLDAHAVLLVVHDQQAAALVDLHPGDAEVRMPPHQFARQPPHLRGEEPVGGRVVLLEAVTEYRAFADPERLLGPEFTLLELLRLHSAIAGKGLGKDTCRRHMLDQLVETDAYPQRVVGKPTKLFRQAG